MFSQGMRKLISHEFAWFVAIGGAQFAIDACIFAAILTFGGNVGVSNVVAKATASLVGYYLNQRYTFGLRGDASHPIRLLRLLGLWAMLTTLSTILLAVWHLLFPPLLPFQYEQAMALGKVVVEILLVPVSFQIAKQWVYKN